MYVGFDTRLFETKNIKIKVNQVRQAYSYGVETGLPFAALNSHGVIGPLIIISASRITMNSASIFA